MAVENSKVLIIVNNWGIEETELTRPLRDLSRRRQGDACRHYLGPV
ncbi:MAG: hypothetical protein ACLS6O_05640 [Bifidobacterium sp.]